MTCGGTLIQDIATQLPFAVQHDANGADPAANHVVDVIPDTMLMGIVGSASFMVNSRHHQAVSGVGHGLRPNCRSADGVVEDLEANWRRSSPRGPVSSRGFRHRVRTLLGAVQLAREPLDDVQLWPRTPVGDLPIELLGNGVGDDAPALSALDRQARTCAPVPAAGPPRSISA